MTQAQERKINNDESLNTAHKPAYVQTAWGTWPGQLSCVWQKRLSSRVGPLEATANGVFQHCTIYTNYWPIFKALPNYTYKFSALPASHNLLH